MHREATAVVSTVLPLLMVLLRASGAAAGCDPSTDPDHADMANALAVSLVAVAAHATTDPLTRCAVAEMKATAKKPLPSSGAMRPRPSTRRPSTRAASQKPSRSSTKRGPAPPPRADPAAISWAH